nr:PREDICTED: uncharacterized protein LOC109042638 [Bemisia tabaci]
MMLVKSLEVIIVLQMFLSTSAVKPSLVQLKRSTTKTCYKKWYEANRYVVLAFLKENPCSQRSTLADMTRHWRCQLAVGAFNKLPNDERKLCPETSNPRCLDKENCVVDLPKPGDPDGRIVETLKSCAKAIKDYQKAAPEFKERPLSPIPRRGRSPTRSRSPPPKNL